MGLVVTAWNLRQGGGKQTARIVDALGELNTDVAVLSEWRATSPQGLEELLRGSGFVHQVGTPDPDSGYASVLIASRRPLEAGTIVYDDPDDGHRFQHVIVDGWSIGGALVPGYERDNDRKRRFWDFLLTSWATGVDEPALLCGDLNTGLHYRDADGATFKSHDQHAALEASGWRDAWIERDRKARPPSTWISTDGNGFRLDHALLSAKSPRARSVDYPTRSAINKSVGPVGSPTTSQSSSSFRRLRDHDRSPPQTQPCPRSLGSPFNSRTPVGAHSDRQLGGLMGDTSCVPRNAGFVSCRGPGKVVWLGPTLFPLESPTDWRSPDHTSL